MDLKTGDVTSLLSVSESKLLTFIREENLPAYKIKNTYHFSLTELGEWVLTHRHRISPTAEIWLRLTDKSVSLLTLLNQGGIWYDIAGKTVAESIRNAVSMLRIPEDLNPQDVYMALMQREEMMSTAVGKGIAFPHPRCPIISDRESESLSLCFLTEKIDFKALDDEPVGVLFVIISSSARRHLEILSKISFLCQQNEFLALLHNRAEEKFLRDYIEKTEENWSERYP